MRQPIVWAFLGPDLDHWFVEYAGYVHFNLNARSIMRVFADQYDNHIAHANCRLRLASPLIGRIGLIQGTIFDFMTCVTAGLCIEVLLEMVVPVEFETYEDLACCQYLFLLHRAHTPRVNVVSPILQTAMSDHIDKQGSRFDGVVH